MLIILQKEVKFPKKEQIAFEVKEFSLFFLLEISTDFHLDKVKYTYFSIVVEFFWWKLLFLVVHFWKITLFFAYKFLKRSKRNLKFIEKIVFYWSFISLFNKWLQRNQSILINIDKKFKIFSLKILQYSLIFFQIFHNNPSNKISPHCTFG